MNDLQMYKFADVHTKVPVKTGIFVFMDSHICQSAHSHINKVSSYQKKI